MGSLFKSFNLIDTGNHEEMYWFTIFKDAVIYHLLQFHINSNHIYDFMTQIVYSQLCDHTVGSLTQFGDPDRYNRLLKLLVQSCTVLYCDDYRYNMRLHFPHLSAVEVNQLVSWRRDVKTQVCACDDHINYPLHGEVPHMGAALPTYEYIRDQAKLQNPEVSYNEIAILRDTVIIKVLSRVFQTGTLYSSQGILGEQQVTSAMAKDEIFTPIEREYLIARLEKEHSHWTPEELEEGMEKLAKHKKKFCPCAEHMKKAAMMVPIFPSLFGIPFTIQRVDPSVSGEAGDNEEGENEGNEDETLVVDSEDEEVPLLCNLCGAEEHSADSELSEYTIKDQSQTDENPVKDNDSKDNEEKRGPMKRRS